MPGFCVLGNHDHTDWGGWLPRYKFQHLHQKIASLRITGKEITLGGFSGAEVYAPGDDWHWTDEDAHHAIQQLPPCDILMTHTAGSPPPDYPLDRHHRGLPPIARYINTHQPPVALHGHFHHNYHTQNGRTQTIGCYGAVLLRCTVTAQTWQVEAKPINQNPW
jgi:Icc-related predicted phosphoesterase